MIFKITIEPDENTGVFEKTLLYTKVKSTLKQKHRASYKLEVFGDLAVGEMITDVKNLILEICLDEKQRILRVTLICQSENSLHDLKLAVTFRVVDSFPDPLQFANKYTD